MKGVEITGLINQTPNPIFIDSYVYEKITCLTNCLMDLFKTHKKKKRDP